MLPLLLLAFLSACSSHRRYAPPQAPSPSAGSVFERGVASWYGPYFHGRRTANGERFDQEAMTAAHRTLPFGTRVLVTHVPTGRTVVVRINDRGPFAKGRVIDLSKAAAREIGLLGPGTGEVDLAVVGAIPPPPRYTVQVGAFGESDRAQALAAAVGGTFPEIFVHADGVWNRVQVGLFSDRDAAESLRRELAAVGYDGFVVAADGRSL